MEFILEYWELIASVVGILGTVVGVKIRPFLMIGYKLFNVYVQHELMAPGGFTDEEDRKLGVAFRSGVAEIKALSNKAAKQVIKKTK